ncbi:NADPH-dependent FMN reductase [Hymenobacter volaticus]|uniref:NAD(P)H-dependent oxidoreductase n=1 Tax=Hymenobacter volaticus TaxID=2932254 RepID=A0ABY4G9T1_9BACT|nr:NAD(P)H-dependent oxidoreductase [Hymenobacter volaticus]UOQ67680.1 NAD(P)H-dependent oxidoreductase [Hymenobacter volaticus]
MHIFAISGSIRPGSSNTALLHAATTLAPPGTTATIYQSLTELPYFMPGNYEESAPAAVANFRQQIRAADAILICTPEYVFSMPGVLKNALEWLVASGELYHKPTAIWSASPSATGGDQAYSSVERMLTVMEARLVPTAALQISHVSARVNKQGEVTDDSLRQELRQAVAALVAAAT